MHSRSATQRARVTLRCGANEASLERASVDAGARSEETRFH
jgi:hypothetical protein